MNKEYAYMLMNDYAGEISEDTAIHMYFYQSIILEKTEPEISKTLEKIAIEEMHHLELLGKMIYKLGELPIYRTIECYNNVPIFFNASYVNYTPDLKSILITNINAERSAIINYSRQRDYINNKEIKDLLTFLISEEERHLNIFNKLYQDRFL